MPLCDAHFVIVCCFSRLEIDSDLDYYLKSTIERLKEKQTSLLIALLIILPKKNATLRMVYLTRIIKADPKDIKI